VGVGVAAGAAGTALPPLIRGLQRPEAYPHPVEEIRLLQTHISWILLTGSVAYKIKKPVDYGFVNFTSLERRRRCCHEEVRLNRRLTPALYQGVVAICGSPERPRIEATPLTPNPDPAAAAPAGIEFAVRMAQFPQEALLPAALARGAVTRGHLDDLAERLARFHAQAATASREGPYGTPAAVREPVEANIASLLTHADPSLAPRLRALEAWIAATFARLEGRFAQRLAAGRVRECHGDLHLGNMLLLQGRIEVFDCLEFNAGLRWIDVISDMAFLVMDLQQRDWGAQAWRLLNHWLEHSGDHDGLELWAWYLSYRALVRAKVAALGGDGMAVERYLALAERPGPPSPAALVLCHGVSGSGKSHHSAELLEHLGAIRLRSDVERKRLFGLWGQGDGEGRQGDPYAPAVGEELFSRRLPELARPLLQAGFRVIIDATFLRRDDRRTMARLAEETGVPLLILAFTAPRSLIEERVLERQRRGHDPSDADLEVLAAQWDLLEPLSDGEAAQAIRVDPTTPAAATAAAIRARLLSSPPGA
jgi:aminoglycoside phosphotransferase family enzyme/predicted kinase